MSNLNENIVCTRYISDFTGHDIFPGNVIAVGRAKGKNLEAKLVTAIRGNRIYFAGYSRSWKKNYNADGSPVMAVHGWGGSSYHSSTMILTAELKKGFSKLSSDEIQQHITLISDPLFAIHNPQMKKIIEMVYELRERKILPHDYKLGQTLIEYEETEE